MHFGSGLEVTFDPAAPRDRTRLRVDGGQGVFGLACPSASDCVTLSWAYNEISQTYLTSAIEGNPRQSHSWTIEPIPGASPASTVACSSAIQCVALDNGGYGYVGMPPSGGTRLSASARSVIAGHRVIFTATASPKPGAGRMIFLADGRRIPRCGAIRIRAATYVARCHTSFAKPGSYDIQAAYIGPTGLSSSQSSTIQEKVRTNVRLRGIRH